MLIIKKLPDINKDKRGYQKKTIIFTILLTRKSEKCKIIRKEARTYRIISCYEARVDIEREGLVMADKELKRMSRPELIEIIYALKSSEESLRKQKADLEEQLNDRTIRIEEAGSIAEAALKLNDIFAIAQESADDYLNSIKDANSSMEEKQHAAQIEAERTVNEAKTQAEKLVEDANEEAARTIAMAKEQADHLISEAKAEVQSMTESAQKQAEEILAAAEQRCTQLEEACSEKSEETQKELEARWDAFEMRVEDVLSQHRELNVLLKNVTAKPTMVSEPVDLAVSPVYAKEIAPESQTEEREQKLNEADNE